MSTNKTLALGVNNYPEKTATVEEFVELGSSDDITYYNFSILEKYRRTRENKIRNIKDKYFEELKDFMKTVSVIIQNLRAIAKRC